MGLTRRCDVFGCGRVKPCPRHGKRERSRETEPDYSSLYDSRRWSQTSDLHLRRYTRCGDRPERAPLTNDSQCAARQQTVAAAVCDHIVPHKGNLKLFWSSTNRQSLCLRCHGIKSQKERRQSAPIIRVATVVASLLLSLY